MRHGINAQTLFCAASLPPGADFLMVASKHKTIGIHFARLPPTCKNIANNERAAAQRIILAKPRGSNSEVILYVHVVCVYCEHFF